MLAGPAGKTPPIHREGRAKTGSVSCFKCGHTHSVGSQCAYDKALKSFLQRYESLEKGKGNTTENRGHNTNHDKTGKWTSSDKAVIVSGPSKASEKKPKPRSGHQKTEVTDKPPGQTTEQSATPSSVSPVAPTIASPSSPSPSESKVSSKKEADPEVARHMFGVKLGSEHAKRMEAEGGSGMSYPWMHNNPIAGISPEHHQEAQGAAQNAHARSKQLIQNTGASDIKANAYANSQAHDAYVSHLADKYAGGKQFLPSDMQQTNPGLRPQNMDVSQASTVGGPQASPSSFPRQAPPTQPESAIPTRNIGNPAQSSSQFTGQTASQPQPQVQPQAGPSPQTKPGAIPAPSMSPPGQTPPSQVTTPSTTASSNPNRGGQSKTNMVTRIGQSIIPTQQAYAMGAGLVQPGQGFRAASSAAAQPVHNLLRPSTQKQPSERDQYQKDRIEDTKFDNSQKQQHMNRLKQWYSKRAA
jgi:hypothetical protein